MKKESKAIKMKEQTFYYLMMFPGIIVLAIFAVGPMFGLLMAFQNYVPAKGLFGSKWVGLQNFQRLFAMKDFWQIIQNTLIISLGKIFLGMVAAVVFAILLNECRFLKAKKAIQTLVYLPHFLSWVILAIMFNNMFSLSGIFNSMISAFGGEPQLLLQTNEWFRTIMVLGETWKEFGYGAIVYIAAIMGIDTSLYEAASMDGATRLERIWHITIPGMLPTIILMLTLNIGQVLNAGFDQIYNLYSPLVYETGDILDTYVYRLGLESLQFSMATAVGLFKAIIGFTLLVSANKLADKLCGYRVF